MGKRVFTLMSVTIIIVFNSFCFAQDTVGDNSFYENKLKYEQMIGYTFGGKGSWANISPEIFLGFDTLMYAWKQNTFRFRFGPTITAANGTIDTGDYLKALMLPGLARLSLNMYAAHAIFNKKLKLAILSGCEIKMCGYTPADKSIIQNSFKAGCGIEFQNLFVISAEHTWAWHNFTNQSETSFLQTFDTKNTRANYLTLSLEGYSQTMNMYIIFCWRKFLNTNNFCDSNDMNNKVVSIGLRKNLSLFHSNAQP